MPGGQPSQLNRVARLLSGIVAPPVLPDMVQHRNLALPGQRANWVEQGIVGAAAGGQLDADHAGVQATAQLAQGVLLKVGIYGGVAADTSRIRALKLEQKTVAVFDIGRGGKVDR